jgi:hypothetical protein
MPKSLTRSKFSQFSSAAGSSQQILQKDYEDLMKEAGKPNTGKKPENLYI